MRKRMRRHSLPRAKKETIYSTVQVHEALLAAEQSLQLFFLTFLAVEHAVYPPDVQQILQSTLQPAMSRNAATTKQPMILRTICDPL
jgi:hypothetical protein